MKPRVSRNSGDSPPDGLQGPVDVGERLVEFAADEGPDVRPVVQGLGVAVAFDRHGGFGVGQCPVGVAGHHVGQRPRPQRPGRTGRDDGRRAGVGNRAAGIALLEPQRGPPAEETFLQRRVAIDPRECPPHLTDGRVDIRPALVDHRLPDRGLDDLATDQRQELRQQKDGHDAEQQHGEEKVASPPPRGGAPVFIGIEAGRQPRRGPRSPGPAGLGIELLGNRKAELVVLHVAHPPRTSRHDTPPPARGATGRPCGI